MDTESLNALIGFGFLYLILTTGLLLHGTALYLLFTKVNKKIMDIILINLCLSELLDIIWDCVYYSMALYTKDNWKPLAAQVATNALPFSIYQSIILITIDRLMAISLPCKYSTLITKTKALCAVTITWLLSIVYGVIIPFVSKLTAYRIWLTCDSLVTTFLTVSYVYIIIVVHLRKGQLNKKAAQKVHNKFKYRTPLLIVLSFILLVFIPDMVLVFKPRYHCIWVPVLWDMNYTLDAFIYVHYSRRFCAKPKTVTQNIVKYSNLVTLSTSVRVRVERDKSVYAL